MKHLLPLLFLLALSAQTNAQDNCSGAATLCNGQSLFRSTIGATPSPLTDPVLSCGDGVINNNVWFQFTAIASGTAVVTVSAIDSTRGLAMEIYSGSCGFLTTTGFCTTGSPATGGTMSVNVPITSGTTYYVMVDGESGNQESFNISATSNQAIVGAPVTDFVALPTSGCAPFSTFLRNLTSLQGGTNIRYDWRIDNGPLLPSSGSDTSVTFNSVGVHSIQLRACNQECGCVSITRDVTAQDLTTSIFYSPATACVGSTITFDGFASILPDPPYVDPDVTSWQWFFDDPGSGASNTASGQSVTHTFVGPQTLFNVRLIVNGLCGPDTVTQLIDLNPVPSLQVSTPVTVCEGANPTISVNVQGASAPYTYAWTGASGNIQCTSCSSTVVTGLIPTGPYRYDVTVTDAQGCTADTSVNVLVNTQPVVTMIDTLIACPGTDVTLFPAITAGITPFTYQWNPSVGLNNPNLQNPIANITSDASYCVIATDAAGCSSVPACTFLDVPVPPTVSPAVAIVCASDQNPQNTFIVNGAAPGSTISWSTSPDYALIIAAAGDSSFITASFPQGVAGTYNFTAIVEDFLTGCIDTLPVSFTLSNLNNLSVTTPAPICVGNSTTLTATGSSTYSWVATPSYSFSNPTAAVQNVTLTATTTFIVTGTTGTCIAVDSVTVVVRPIPVISPFAPWQICEGSSVSIITNITQGTPPLTFSWTPVAGLIGPNTQNPTATPTVPTTYCVTATDSIGCSSVPECINISFYDPPTIDPAVSTVCATDPNPQNTFVLNGASAGSTITWSTSLDYPLVVSAAADSTFITVNFPPNIAANYSFTAIVEDFTTGCIDTVTTTFSVTNPNNLSVSGPSAICSGDTVNLLASGTATYSWSSNPPTVIANPQSASQSVSISVTTDFYITGTTGTCSQTDTFTVVVNPLPDIQVTPPLPSCGCDTLVLSGSSTAAASFQWSAGNGLPLTNPLGPTTIGYGCNGDIFTLTVADLLTGCSADSAVSAIGRPSPTVLATVSPTIICPGTPTVVTLSGSGSDTTSNTLDWSSSDISVVIGDSTALNTTATVTAGTVFTLTITDSFGCDSSASDTVFIQPPPVISANTPYLCTSDAVLQSLISVSGASAGSVYTWSTVPGCVTPTNPSGPSATFDFSSCLANSFTFNIRVDDPATGCSTDLTTAVNLVDGVSLFFDQDTVRICEGNVASAVINGANSYLWSNGATSDSVGFSGLTAAGSPYSFSVTGTIGSCTTTSSVIIEVDPVNTIAPIQGPAIACSNDSTITYYAPSWTPGYVWSVSGGTLLTGQGTDSITVAWGLGLNGTVTLSDTSTTGCPGTPDTLQVTISQSPAVPPLITGNFDVCDSTLEVYNVFGGLPGSLFTWNVTNGQIINDNGSSILVQWPDSGQGTVSVFETTSGGCPGQAVTNLININDIPAIPTITGTQLLCQGDTGFFAVNLNPSSGYIWNLSSSIPIIGFSADNDTAFMAWTNAGTDTVSVTETNSFGCSSDPAIFPVNISPIPSAIILTGPLNTCQNTDITLTSLTPSGTLTWTTSGSGSFSDTSLASTTYSTGLIDTGRVDLVLTAESPGCPSASDTLSITVQPVPDISVSSSADTVCFATPDTLSVSGTGSYSYNWTTPVSTDSVIIVTPQATTTYTVIATSAFGCTSSDSVTVHVIPPGIPDAGSDIIACFGDPVQLNGSQLNATGLIWSTSGDGMFLPSDTEAVSTYLPGPNDTIGHTGWIYLTTIGACFNLTDSLQITYTGIPTVNAGPDTLLTSGFTNNITLPLQPSVSNVTNVIWSTSGTGFFDPSDTSLNAVYVPSEDDFGRDSIVITLTSVGGCQTASDEFIIEISPFVIPNVFTPYPASPGKNDFFVIKGLPERSMLKIFDRWGVLVFESTDYRNNWDAANLEAETFFYVLESRGREFHGWIQVIRED